MRFLAGVIVGGVAGVITGAIAVGKLVQDKLEEIHAMKPTFEVKEGDMIQWNSNGTYRFESPRKVRKIAVEEDHGTFVFVEGSESGIPIKEVVKFPNKVPIPSNGEVSSE